MCETKDLIKNYSKNNINNYKSRKETRKGELCNLRITIRLCLTLKTYKKC